VDYVRPAEVVKAMIEASRTKLLLKPRDLLIRGALSGALLGTATSFAFMGAVTTGQPLVGALIFPVSLVMIVILGLELVTGSFALVPLAYLERRSSVGSVIANWGWVFLGNLLGSVAYGVLLAIVLTNFWHTEPTGVAARIVATAEAKTIGYEALGAAGMFVAFVKAILCNWLVCLGVVMAMASSSTTASWWAPGSRSPFSSPRASSTRS
jgi:formate/nitrite transporter FocA (FNT family)